MTIQPLSTDSARRSCEHQETADCTEQDTSRTPIVSYPTRQLSQLGYDNLQVFLTLLLIIQETGVPFVLGTYLEKDPDTPRRLHLRTLLFNLVNQSFLMPLLFFLFGRLAQKASYAGDGLRKIQLLKRGCRKLLPAIACKVLLQRISSALPANGAGLERKGASVNPIVSLPLLLVIFDFMTSSFLGKALQNGTRSDLIVRLRAARRMMVLISWLHVIVADFILRSQFPAEILSKTIFRPTDIPVYFYAYMWGRLAVPARDMFILTLCPPIKLPILSTAMAVLFSNLALLDTFCMVIPGLSNGIDLSEWAEARLKLMGGGFNTYALIYSVWKVLSFGSISPGLLASFIEYTDQELWVMVPGVGRRRLKRYTYAMLLVYLPLSRLLHMWMETFVTQMSAPAEERRPLYFSSSIASGLAVGAFGFMNALAAGLTACILVEYVPYMNQIL